MKLSKKFLSVTLICLLTMGIFTTHVQGEEWYTTSMDYMYDYERVVVGTGILSENYTFHWKIESEHPVNIFFLDVYNYNQFHAGRDYTKLGLVEGVTNGEGNFDIPHYDGWQLIIQSAYSGQFEVKYNAWATEKSTEDVSSLCSEVVLTPGIVMIGLAALYIKRKRF